MRTINKELSLEERTAQDSFYQRIGKQDTANVKRVITLVDDQAEEYFLSPDLEHVHYLFQSGEAFFAVYGIGGNLTKQGQRPDIDIMIVTNMRYQNGFLEDYNDRFDDPDYEHNIEPVWRNMNQQLKEQMTITKENELPNNYNLGLTKGKCLISLTPKNGARKIDAVYVRSMHHHADLPSAGEEPGPQIDDTNMHFKSEADFISKDLDTNNQPLPRVILYRASTTDIQKPTYRP